MTPELIAVPRGHHVESWSVADRRLVRRLFVGAPVLRAAATPTRILTAVAIGSARHPRDVDDHQLVLQGWSFDGTRVWSWDQGVDIAHHVLAAGSHFVVSLSTGERAVRASDGRMVTGGRLDVPSAIPGSNSARGEGWVVDHRQRAKARLIMADVDGRMRVRAELPGAEAYGAGRLPQLLRLFSRLGHRGIAITTASQAEELPLDPTRWPPASAEITAHQAVSTSLPDRWSVERRASTEDPTLTSAHPDHDTEAELSTRFSQWLYVLLLARGDDLARSASRSRSKLDELDALRSAMRDERL